MASTPEDAIRTMISNLKASTGRTLPEWLKLTGKSGLTKHGQLVAWLKKEHGMTHGYANLVAHQTLKSDAVSATAQGVDLVAAQYSGAKAKLKPIYDALVASVKQLGADVEISPKKTYVSLRRSKQFGLIQPGPRLIVGLNLKDVAPHGRLEPSGSFNAMVTHKVVLDSTADVDAGLVKWLRQAYEQA